MYEHIYQAGWGLSVHELERTAKSRQPMARLTLRLTGDVLDRARTSRAHQRSAAGAQSDTLDSLDIEPTHGDTGAMCKSTGNSTGRLTRGFGDVRIGLRIVAITLLLSVGTASAQQRSVPQLIPPELILKHRSEIELSDQQHQQISAIAEKFGPKIETAKRGVKANNEKLSELFRAESIDEAAGLKRLRALVAAEQEVRQLHFTALLRMHNVLTKKQRATLIAKMKGIPQNAPNQQRAVAQQPPASLARLPRPTTRSYSELRRQVRELHVEDVAWRKIAWETCLLEGLKRSADERKPLVLWVFIDRPIDDERC